MTRLQQSSVRLKMGKYWKPIEIFCQKFQRLDVTYAFTSLSGLWYLHRSGGFLFRVMCWGESSYFISSPSLLSSPYISLLSNLRSLTSLSFAVFFTHRLNVFTDLMTSPFSQSFVCLYLIFHQTITSALQYSHKRQKQITLKRDRLVNGRIV